MLKPSFVVFAYLRAAAPAADPETKHQERQFLLKFFFFGYHISNLGRQKAAAKRWRNYASIPVWVDFIRTEDMSWYLVL